MYSQDEVYKASLEYFRGNELAADVFVTKYPLRDNKGNFTELTLDDRHKAIAKVFARMEQKWPDKETLSEEQIYNLFAGEKYLLLQGSPLAAIANDTFLQSSSNCFVIEAPYDSYGGICYTDEELAQLMKRRGGVGLNIDTLRPANSFVANAARTSSGIGSWQQRFSNTCREVGQDGRRGAEMQICSIHHPEISTFINIKRDKTKVTGANLTVNVTNQFMNALSLGDVYEQRFPVELGVHGVYEHSVLNYVPALDIWTQIIDAAWDNAEPGVAFIDTIREYTPGNAYETIFASNPCGEIFMAPYDSCRLMVLNLTAYVVNPFTKDAYFDYELFKAHSQIALRLLDDLVEIEIELIDRIIAKIESDPEPLHVKERELNLWKKVRHTAVSYRRTGLGITGLADMLAGLRISYASDKAVETTELVYKTMTTSAYFESYRLANVRGPFPAWKPRVEANHPFLNNIEIALFGSSGFDFPRRNVALTTTAPVGSRSLMADCFGAFGTTSGIEPVWKIKSKRRKRITNNDVNVIPDFIDELGDKWKTFTVNHSGYDVMKSIDPEADYYVEADAVPWQIRLQIQQAAQKWVCHSISSTINLPKDVPKQTIQEIYATAFAYRLKGVTVYRDTCRDGILISDTIDSLDKPFSYIDSVKRPPELKAKIFNVSSAGVRIAVLVGLLDDKPFEVFVRPGRLDIDSDTLVIRKTKDNNNQTSYSLVDTSTSTVLLQDVRAAPKALPIEYHAITRLTSMLLRHHVNPRFVVEQLTKCASASDAAMYTCYALVSRVLKNFISDDSPIKKVCPSCSQQSLIYVEGCIQCTTCGFSKCG